jgi:hypothetical protein
MSGQGYRHDVQGYHHRKSWEYARCLHALDTLGVLHPNATGLALAAGHEAVHYYLSTRVKMMYAGDIYGALFSKQV